MTAATVVLVHGAWHGAWCWDRVEHSLTAANVDTVAIDLPGHGASTDPLTDLHGDAAAVTATLEQIDGEIVLVGHSYGGAVVTEAGTHRRVRHLVYLAAFNLDVGETVAYAAADEARAARLDHSGRPKLAPALLSEDGGATTRVRPDAAAEIFYNACSAETVAWAIPQLGEQRMANLSEAVTACGWRDRPSTYVACRRDNTVHPDLQRILGRRATNFLEWDTDHSPFLSSPDHVVDLLRGLAAG